jgi:hypothetical protein
MKNTLYFLFLGILLATLSCASDTVSTSEVENLKRQIAETEAKIQSMDNTKTGLIHSVFFWLKDGISAEEKAQFEAGVKSLSAISHVKSFYMGPPAGTEERGVVDKSYSLALICHFEDQAGQDAYQVDPIHLKFVDENKGAWTKVIVYDNLVK